MPYPVAFREDLYVNMPNNLQRFVLQIAEVNEDNVGIKKETVTTIDESKAGEIPREYSNTKSINRLLIRRRSPLSLILEKELVAFRSGTGITSRSMRIDTAGS